MAKFLYEDSLNAEIINTIKQAKKYLIIVSPYIKLNKRVKDALDLQKNNFKLEITFVFGKNNENISKSLSLDDLRYLKEFPNISIKYNDRLHAKFYSNEERAILSSMNLYEFSQSNNIEVGILMGETDLKNITMENDCINYFNDVIETSSIVFEKTPITSSYFGLGIGEKLEDFEVQDLEKKFFKDPGSSININSNYGYCIRTRVKIPFDPKKPYSAEAYESWAKYKNPDFNEKYCHKTGKASNGKTSMRNPIMR